MKKFIALIFMASTLVLAGGCCTHRVSQWEYKNITIIASDPDQNPWLNKLGKEGWNMVGFAAQPQAGQASGPGDLYEFHYVFKRRIR